MIPTDLVQIVVGPGRGTPDRTIQQIIGNQHPKRKTLIEKTYKDQNDASHNIYRFEDPRPGFDRKW